MMAGVNPFDDDDDDYARRQSPVSNAQGTTRSGNVTSRTVTINQADRYGDDDQEEQALTPQQLLQQQKQQSMQRQLAATQRCISSVYDSEAIGIATAEDLVHQGEQLDNIERKTDQINADTKLSQRHLNGIKSIFGGLKNWWQGEPKKDTSTTAEARPTRSGGLQDTLAAVQERRTLDESNSLHPALRLRSDNAAADFYADDIQTFNPSAAYNPSASSNPFDDPAPPRGKSMSTAGVGGSVGVQKDSVGVGKGVEWDQYEASLNKNLDVMSGGLSQLKMLAKGLNEEIETQNDQLDRIAPKVDRADIKIRDQNRQMRQILGTTNKK